jgi:hypothetical protein
MKNYYRHKSRWVSRFKWSPPSARFTRDYIVNDINRKRKTKKDGKKQIRNVLDEIAKFEHWKKFKFYKHKNRKVKNVTIWRLKRGVTECHREFRKTDIAGFKKHFSIDQVTTKLVGFTPNYIGFQPSKPLNSKNYIFKYLDEVIREDYQKHPISDDYYEVATTDKEVWSGGYDTNGAHLRNFFVKKEVDCQLTVDQILQIVADCPWFVVPNLEFDDPTEMYNCVNYNPKAGPGIMFKKLTKQVRKEYTKLMAYTIALELYERIGLIATTNFSLWEINAREKEVKMKSEKEPTTRLILNPEHHITMLMCWFFQKFLDSVSFANPNVKFLIHKEYDGHKAYKFYNNIVSKYDWLVDADWSLFDSSQTQEYLQAALLIMFSKLDFTNKSNKRLLFFIMESTIKKYIALPPGIVVECKQGMPSGHPGVTAINCYVNLIRWAIIGYEIYGKNFWEYMDITVYGDDALVGFKNSPNLFKIDEIASKYGFVGDTIKGRLYPTKLYNQEKHRTPDFLKRRFDLFGVYWNRTKLFNNLIFQSDKRDINLQIDLILGYIQTGPFDLEMNDLLFKTLNKMMLNHHDLIRNEYKNKITKIKIDFDRFMLRGDTNVLKQYEDDAKIFNTGGQINVQNFKTDLHGFKIYNAIHESRFDEIKLLLKFTTNAEFLNFFYGERKFFILPAIYKQYFTKIDDCIIPNECVRKFNNVTLFNTS